jgi:hypothetical protein
MIDDTDIGPGAVIFQKRLTNVHPTVDLTYKANKGKLFVSVLLGVVDDGTQYETDPDKLLNQLGYYLKEENKA